MNKNKIMKIIIIIAVICIPVMYSFFYLKAFWDPYENLEDIKVAIVNLDEGENNENLGEELVNELKENEKVKFIFLNDGYEAEEGLINEEYYATITIPKEFTKDLNSCDEIDRKTTVITYSPNQKNNYLASQIINNVVGEIEKNLRAEASQKVVATLSDNLSDIPNKMQNISIGTEEIRNGSQNLSFGLKNLNEGINRLKINYDKFNDGIKSSYKGISELDNGINNLNNEMDKVLNGSEIIKTSIEDINNEVSEINKLNDGLNVISDKTREYINGVNLLVNSVSSNKEKIETLGEDIEKFVSLNPDIMNNSDFQKIMLDLKAMENSNEAGLENLKNSGNELLKGIENVNLGVDSFVNKIEDVKKLEDGAVTLNDGINQIKSGVEQLNTGSSSLKTGIKQLNDNSGKINEGIYELNNATYLALNESNKLTDGVAAFKEEIDSSISDTQNETSKLEGLDEYVKEPVKIEEQDYGNVDSYGLGFAPYFISISLWVGALIAIVMFYGDSEKRFVLLGSQANNKCLRILLYIGIAAMQGIVLGFLLKLGLGYKVTNILLYYSIMILISIAFMSIEYFLIINFNDVGKFLCILLLVLQLAASAGTFPIETVPMFFQDIYSFMPMNYTIRLLKEALVQLNSEVMLHNATIIFIIFLIFVTLIMFGDKIKTIKKCKIKK